MTGVVISFPFPPSFPSYGQWVSYFALCQPNLGFTPLNRAGDTMLGTLLYAPGVGMTPAQSTVASLPSPALNLGAVFVVTDALGPTWNSTLVGGGAIVCLALSNGTHWVAA